jgi:hypothetical protein
VLVNDVNLLGRNKYPKEITETLLDTSKDGLNINTEKTKCMLMSYQLSTGQSCCKGN